MISWQTKSSKVVYENPWMRVHEDQVIMPNGNDGMYGYVESKSDSVYVIPIDNEGLTYIVQQERYTIKQLSWECVAGRNEGDDIETAAKRELLEETGLQANTIIPIGRVRAANGMSTFVSTFCIAKDLVKVSEELDEKDGIIAAKRLTFEEVRSKIMSGEITCSQSIAAFFMAMTYLEKETVV